MKRNFRVIVYNTDKDFAPEIRAGLLSVPGVKIIAEIDEVAEISLLGEGIEGREAEVLVVNLGSKFQLVLPLIRELHYRKPELVLFGVSRDKDPQFVLEAMRAGLREIVYSPIASRQIDEFFQNLARLSPEKKNTGKLLCITSCAGGVGATTLAVNLACELGKVAKRGVALVDLNLPFSDIASMMDVTAQFTLADLCKTSKGVDADMVEKSLVKHFTGVNVLVSTNDFSQGRTVGLDQCKPILNVLTDMFEYVVCDGPSRMDVLNKEILGMADIVLVVLNLLIPNIRNTDHFIRYLETEGFNLDRLQLVVNRYGKENGPLRPADVEQTLERKIVCVLPNDWVLVSKAVNMGQPLSQVQPKSKIALAIGQLALNINESEKEGEHGVGGNGKAKKVTRTGLLSRLLGR
jgi:pilus assembly protein CpaE